MQMNIHNMLIVAYFWNFWFMPFCFTVKKAHFKQKFYLGLKCPLNLIENINMLQPVSIQSFHTGIYSGTFKSEP